MKKYFFEIETDLPSYKRIHTDGFYVYENLRNRSKFGLTNWNEELHSGIRDKLAMFKKKTKAYAKSVRVMERNLTLLFVFYVWTIEYHFIDFCKDNLYI